MLVSSLSSGPYGDTPVKHDACYLPHKLYNTWATSLERNDLFDVTGHCLPSSSCCSHSCPLQSGTMLSGSRFKRRDSNLSDKSKPNVLTRSPPSSPQASEVKQRPREPYPVPSNNPANQYTLLEKLGTGSFGVVYKAIHNDTKQVVAIKQIGTSDMSYQRTQSLTYVGRSGRLR